MTPTVTEAIATPTPKVTETSDQAEEFQKLENNLKIKFRKIPLCRSQVLVAMTAAVTAPVNPVK